jgi:flagella basal body P-ring formation protein FlgA
MWLELFIAMSLAGCIPVSGDKVTAGDLAPEVPELGAFPSSTSLGYAPVAGARRYFRPGELRRFLRAHGQNVEKVEGVCVERSMMKLDSAILANALRQTLGPEPASIEVLEFPRGPVPEGEIHIPPDGAARLGTDGTTAQWRAYVQYGESRRYSFLFKARVLAEGLRLVAAKSLRAGQTLEASDIAEQPFEGVPLPTSLRISAGKAEGKMLRHGLAAGAEIHSSDLEDPPAIRRGDLVTVIYRAGPVQVKLSARALTDGALGEVISLRNETSGKTIQARVVGPLLAELGSSGEPSYDAHLLGGHK